MEHTQNYNLPQWVESDRIRMNDFNAAMASIESGLTANAQAAASAQSAASTAQAAAEEKPYAAGSYVGSTQSQMISVGFPPSCVIISGMQQSDTLGTTPFFTMTAGGNDLIDRVKLLQHGFIVYSETYQGVSYPSLNKKGVTYDYIAFK